MKFDKIIVEPCLNPALPLAACPNTPRQPPVQSAPLLLLKPAVLCLAQDGSAQLRAFAYQDGIEMEIHGGLTFTSSDQSIATVGATSGNVTGANGGIVSISVDWNGQTAASQVTVIGEDGPEVNVGMVLLIDDSLSMAQPFGGAYSTRLSFAKAATKLFAGDLNTAKDEIALMRFDEAGELVEDLTNGTALIQAKIDSLSTTTLSTNLHDALTAAADVLGASATVDKRVIVLVTDGQNKLGPNPEAFAASFKDAGGIIAVLGLRAADDGYDLLNKIASPGLFINAVSSNAADAVLWFRSLKGYFCAGNCTPPGDVYVGRGALDYTQFKQWAVSGGHVDLIGGTPPYAKFDLLPGNGLYLDMAGSSGPYMGTIQTLEPIALVAGKTYELSFYLAGNQRESDKLEIVRARLGTVLNEHINIVDWKQGFTRYSYEVTPLADEEAILSFTQIMVTGTQYYGTLLDNVTVRNVTDSVDVFSDDFDEENSSYIQPACGPSVVMASGKDLINLNIVEDGDSAKTGAAAIGTAGDFWNGYQPRLLNGAFLPSLPLRYADGSDSNAAITQFPDPGERWWQTIGTTISTDELMVRAAQTKDNPDEVDPWQECADFATFNAMESGCRWLAIVGLTAGSYDFYVYGHGGYPVFNSRFRLTVEFAAEVEKQTNEGNGYLGAYAEGEQYVVFRNVQVATGQTCYLFLLPPEDNSSDVNFNSWNGLQILRKQPPMEGSGYPYGSDACAGYGCLRDPIPEQEEDLVVLPDPEQEGLPTYLAYQCFTAVCPSFTSGDDVTECASSSSHMSQAHADKKALNRARKAAEAAIACVGETESFFFDTIPSLGDNYLLSLDGSFALINQDSGNYHIIHIEGAFNEEDIWWEDAVPLSAIPLVTAVGLNYEWSTSNRFRIVNSDTIKCHGMWTTGEQDEEQLEIGTGGISAPDGMMLSGPRFRFYLNLFWVKNIDTGLWNPLSFVGPDSNAQLDYGVQSV